MSDSLRSLRAGLPAALTLVGALAADPVRAQTPSTQPNVPLPPVEVTAPAARPKPAPKQAQPVAVQPPASAPPPASSAESKATAPGSGASQGGQTVSTIERSSVENTRAFSVGDLLSEVPGISIKQGNGPRDMGVSIRGSNARNGFGVRNIQVFEDGFPVTQPDGLSRTDLTDPHAYGGVDVWRGPSSALFGNYATGGAINFRTRTGADINGFEYGVDVGSFGYLNNYLALGEKKGNFEYSLFASDVRGNGHLDYNGFNTQTVNLLASFTPSSSDKFTFKFVHNALETQLSYRLSLNQFNKNPFQKGCDADYSAALATAGCGSNTFFVNGYNGAKVPLTAAQAGFNRTDYRTLAGLRWEHKVDANTEWQMQAVVDDRNINQPTGTTSAIGDYLSTNLMASMKQRYSFFGAPAVHLAGVWYNTLPNDGYTYNVMPGGDAKLGRLTQNVNGGTTNAGARVREEITPTKGVTLVLGADVEQSHVWGLSTAYSYPTATPTLSYVSTDRTYMNHAQEAALVLRPDSAWQFRGRVATGYGTPQIGNLFTTQAGTAGDNTSLQSQTNLGYDLGVDWMPSKAFKLSLTGFYEFFQNEIVSQVGSSGSGTFQFNAPRSEHRGVELAADWRPLPGWRATAAYLYMDQVYTEYSERPSGGTTLFDRAGNKIPGNSPNELLARVGYDQPTGALKGFGAYVEYQWKDSFYMDNGNYLKAPGYELYNLNVHFTPELGAGPVKAVSFYFEVRNLLDKTYIASANNVANSQSGGVENGAATLANSSSIYAGLPRTFYGGMKVKF
jgi:iron complex outermembrane receptor protein